MPAAILCAALLLTGCTAPVSQNSGSTIPQAHKISRVPYVRQKENYCGPASAEMVLKYHNIDQYGQDRIATCDTLNRTGTRWKKMVLFLNQTGSENGFSVRVQSGNFPALKTCIANDRPVIVRQWSNIERQSRHYRVVTGYDDGKKVFTLHDPQTGRNTKINYAKFRELWIVSDRRTEWASNNLMIVISKHS